MAPDPIDAASANKTKYDLAMVAKSRAVYGEALDAAVEEDRAVHGKKPLRPEPREPEIKVSRTDSQAGYMVREGKPKGFFYLDHRTVDGQLGITTYSNARSERVPRTINVRSARACMTEFPISPDSIGSAKASACPWGRWAGRRVYHGRHRQGAGRSRYPGRHWLSPADAAQAGLMRKTSFVYDREADVYRCPQGLELAYATTNRGGHSHYKSDPAICAPFAAARLLHGERQSRTHYHPAHLAGRASAPTPTA